jgi:hypothetical protein
MGSYPPNSNHHRLARPREEIPARRSRSETVSQLMSLKDRRSETASQLMSLKDRGLSLPFWRCRRSEDPFLKPLFSLACTGGRRSPLSSANHSHQRDYRVAILKQLLFQDTSWVAIFKQLSFVALSSVVIIERLYCSRTDRTFSPDGSAQGPFYRFELTSHSTCPTAPPALVAANSAHSKTITRDLTIGWCSSAFRHWLPCAAMTAVLSELDGLSDGEDVDDEGGDRTLPKTKAEDPTPKGPNKWLQSTKEEQRIDTRKMKAQLEAETAARNGRKFAEGCGTTGAPASSVSDMLQWRMRSASRFYRFPQQGSTWSLCSSTSPAPARRPALPASRRPAASSQQAVAADI